MKKCRQCGVELMEGENWYPSLAKKNSRICIECKKAGQHQWREEHPDYQSSWRKRNREYVREYQRQYRQAHLVEHRASQHRRRACENGATSGPVDEAAIFERDGMCMYCGATHKKLTLDHIVALSNGGPHCVDNVVAACGQCNRSKYTKPLEEWLRTQPYSIAWLF